MCNVPRHPILRRTPLTTVVCQVRYPKILGLSEADVRPFQRRLGDDYPDFVPGEVQEFLIGPGVIRQSQGQERVYQFRTLDGTWAVSLAAESLSLETSRYQGFDDFVGRWRRVLGAAVEQFEIRRQDRLGFRFINEIEMPAEGPLERMRQMIRAELITPLGAHQMTQDIIQSLQELRLRQPTGYCTLRHGYVVKPDGKHVYLVDLDFYDDTKRDLIIDENAQALAAFDDGLDELFKWSVTEEAYQSFEPETAA